MEAINTIAAVDDTNEEESEELLAKVKEAMDEETFQLLLSYYDKEQPIDVLMRTYKKSASGVKMRVKRAQKNLKCHFLIS